MSANERLHAAREYYRYKLLTSRGARQAEGEPPLDYAMLTHMGALMEHLESLELEKARAEYHLDRLREISKALSGNKTYSALLETIQQESKAATGADAGSIYLIEEVTVAEARKGGLQDLPEDDAELIPVLRFMYSHTFSKDLPYERFILKLDTNSIAGYVASTGKVLNIPDVYNLTSEDPVSFNSHFDTSSNYRTKSMLVVPMKNHQDKIIGVIQLINCKDKKGMPPGRSANMVRLVTTADYANEVVSFPDDHEKLLQTIASQAAIALENRRMIRQIEDLFDKFVDSVVAAIESRDKTTAGHSKRVAESCVEVAREINRLTEGPFKDVSFSPSQIRELDYAAKLHDFGKVYLESDVFLKSKKLFPHELDVLKLRLDLLYRSIEADGLRHAALPEAVAAQLATIRLVRDDIVALNEPTVTESDPADRVAAILTVPVSAEGKDLEGTPLPILTPREATCLSIRRGTLTAEEFAYIRSHVEHSYNFLSQIPWPDNLRNIPDIAGKHHEMLDGSGYPNHVSDPAELSLQSRLMAIADIWDALTAKDRPYKPAVPNDKSCAILREDARKGKLDSDLVELFISVKQKQET